MPKTVSKTKQPSLADVLLTFRQAAPLFHALGDHYRQDIIMLLAQNERMNVTQLADVMPLSRPAISHHLKVLLQSNLVKIDRVSRENFYSLTVDDALVLLRKFVEQSEIVCT